MSLRGQNRICKHCSTEFIVKNSASKGLFCTKKCAAIFNKAGFYERTDEQREKLRKAKLGKTAWNKGRKGRQKNHNISGLTGVNGNIPWNKGIVWEEMRGENNPRWIKDRSKLVKRQERNDSAYYGWRRAVWERDGFKCRISNDDCCGKIVAHHILGWALYPELRYKINNGITLCRAHHPLRRAEEKRLVPKFQELVSVSSDYFGNITS